MHVYSQLPRSWSLIPSQEQPPDVRVSSHLTCTGGCGLGTQVCQLSGMSTCVGQVACRRWAVCFSGMLVTKVEWSSLLPQVESFPSYTVRSVGGDGPSLLG